ncbi:KH domain-containing protein [Patescibacteria group bacterium]|nr:KH domain-containing protein [Patescibacteria group bacterium]MBU1868616.1 KH domain-containing protein [Patescibacteria group bacterium]
MDTQLVAEAQQTAQELLGLLGIPVDVVVEIDQDEVIRINLSSKDQENIGILIGYHGATLHSLQLILALVINRGRDDWFRVQVDIDGYRKKREDALTSLARRTMEKAKFLGEEIALPPMNSFDRRIVHLAVSETDGVVSESVGEEPRRRVVIKPGE